MPLAINWNARKRTFGSVAIHRDGKAFAPRMRSDIRDANGPSVELDRKQLSELAIHDPQAFDAVVEKAKAAIA